MKPGRIWKSSKRRRKKGGVHGLDKPNSDIAIALKNMDLRMKGLCRLVKALGMHGELSNMELTVCRPCKPHSLFVRTSFLSAGGFLQLFASLQSFPTPNYLIGVSVRKMNHGRTISSGNGNVRGKDYCGTQVPYEHLNQLF